MDLDYGMAKDARPRSQCALDKPTAKKVTTHSDHDDNRSRRHQPNHRSLEPQLTILEIEAHLG